MFGRLRKVSLPVLSAALLFCSYHYARVLGVVCFRIDRRPDQSLAVRKQHRLKLISLSLRLVCATAVCCFCLPFALEIEDPYDFVLHGIRLASILVSSVCIMVVQIGYEHELLRMVSSFLRLFQRVRRLWSLKRTGFGGKREFFLLLIKSACLFNELYCKLNHVWQSPDLLTSVTMICEAFIEIGALMTIHIGFLGYLSVAALYSECNCFVRVELRRQLRSLERSGGGPVTRRHLRIVEGRLDECISIYDGIERVGHSFHRLFELPLFTILLSKIFATTIMAYDVIIRSELYPDKAEAWGVMVKCFTDVVLVTLAAHEAVSSSRVVRRLSLENCPLSDHKEWHQKWEMFLGRLNFFEFRVRPLGLFEVSNEMILVFLSSIISYFTYVVQYGVQTNQL